MFSSVQSYFFFYFHPRKSFFFICIACLESPIVVSGKVFVVVVKKAIREILCLSRNIFPTVRSVLDVFC